MTHRNQSNSIYNFMTQQSKLKQLTQIYLKNRPLFLSLIRGKELQLYYQQLEETVELGRTLDFGSGDGFFLDTLLKSLPRLKSDITGLEVESIDPYLLRQSQNFGAYQDIVTYDGCNLPFADASFDTIISNCVLEHVTHLDQNLAELARVLKPSRKFYTTVMTKNWEKYLFGAIFAKDIYKSWMRRKQVHPNLLSCKEWEQEFKEAGFRVVEVKGYLDEHASRWMDFLHYVSVPSLITYKLANNWVLLPRLFDLLPIADWVAGLTRSEVDPNDAAALFYVLEKA